MDKRNRFDKWIARNPNIYKLFRRFAEQYRDAGFDKCSAALIGNRIRWEVAIKTVGNDLKLSNDFLPMLARKLACDDPTFISFFSFHGLTGETADDVPEGNVLAN